MSDLIDRQAVIDALYDWSNHSMTDAETWHIRQVIGDIKSMPSAQPEQLADVESIIEDLTPTTHLISWWTERKHGYGVEHIPHCKCANCGVTYPPRIAQNIKYCAYCGARFEERDK